MHSEVGVLEAEEDRVEAATEHVQKALNLDVRGEHQERLSAALHALRLRSMLYETPQRSQDRAALLIQQVRRYRHHNHNHKRDHTDRTNLVREFNHAQQKLPNKSLF